MRVRTLLGAEGGLQPGQEEACEPSFREKGQPSDLSWSNISGDAGQNAVRRATMAFTADNEPLFGWKDTQTAII